MSVITTLRRALTSDKPRDEERAGSFATWNDYLSAVALGTVGGTLEQALRNAASWACIDVLTDGIARTPFDAVRTQGKVRVPIEPQPQILTRPSGIVRADVWRTQLAMSLVTDYNAFGRVIATDRDMRFPQQIELLDPCVVGQREVVDGIPQVSIQGAPAEQLWPFGPIWHVPGRLVLPGSPFGVPILKYAAKTLGTTLAVEDFSNRYFSDGGHPTMAIYAESTMNPKQAQEVKDAYRRAVAGSTREPVVFGSGLKIDTLQTDPNATQFIDLWRFEVEQACRFWRVPPSMVYAATSGQNVTYANVTQADLNYLKHSLDGYLVRIENAESDLVPDPVAVKANRNAILRADVDGRYGAYQTAVRNGWLSRNEIRALEDLAPIPDGTGDEFLWPPYRAFPIDSDDPTAPAAPAPTGDNAQ